MEFAKSHYAVNVIAGLPVCFAPFRPERQLTARIRWAVSGYRRMWHAPPRPGFLGVPPAQKVSDGPQGCRHGGASSAQRGGLTIRSDGPIQLHPDQLLAAPR